MSRPTAPNRRLLLTPLALALAFGLACSTPARVYTPDDVEQAVQSQDLEGLYERVAGELAALDPDSKAAQSNRETLAEIGGRLASERADEVNAAIVGARLEGGLVPLEALRNEQLRIAKIERWDPEVYKKLATELEQELEATNDSIEEKRARLEELTGDQALERLKVLEALGELSGAGSDTQAAYSDQRLSILEDMRRRADEALSKEDLDEAQRVLMILQQADPGDDTVAPRLVVVDEKVFERDFWSALEAGDPDKAFEAFDTLASSTSFEAVKPSLEGSADKMATYFGILAGEATEAENYEDAYRWFLQARQIREALGYGESKLSDEEAQFLDKMQVGFDKAQREKRPGLAWGYLDVVRELGPMSPTLRRQLRETREEVLQAASRRLTAFRFGEASEGGPEFGDAISSKIIQFLFEAIPQDLRIVERQELEKVEREKRLGGEGGKDIASADYIVQGNILEAKVDTAKKEGRKTVRVVTEEREERNPKHEWWMGLDSKERKDYPEPPEMVIVPLKEDISFGVTVHRKVGIFSVSYRVIDADSAKVLYADSVRSKIEHQDESREGIELGDFVQEFKLAELPSDIEILTQLADEISQEIGERIADRLKDPEDRYKETADRFASEGNVMGASEQAAYAVVLAERKGKDVEEWRSELRRYTVSTTSAVLD